MLASTSGTRRKLLERAEIPVETCAPEVNERALEASLGEHDPEGLASVLAQAKALAVSRRLPGRIVVGADQVMTCAGVVLHKPANRANALVQLTFLSGRTHTLHSAGAIAVDGVTVELFAASARLTMRQLSPSALSAYLDGLDPAVLGSTGVYRWEERGAHLFEKVEGDHSTILGLPLIPLLVGLRRLGCLAF
jgi:septum formation protein